MTFGPENLKAPAPLTGYAAVIAENLRILASRKGAASAEAILTLVLWLLSPIVFLLGWLLMSYCWNHAFDLSIALAPIAR